MTKRDKLSEELREYFRKQGSIGGKKRSESMTAEERRELAKKAVQTRWSKAKTKKISKKQKGDK